MTKSNGLPCKKCGTRDWYKDGKCKQCKAERDRRYQQAHPDKVAEKNHRYQLAHPERRAAQVRRWCEANASLVAEKTRRWREAYPEKEAEKNRRWRQNNPTQTNAATHRRRTRKTEAGGSYTAKEWQTLCAHYGNRCLCCGRDDVKLTADHIKPVSKGGHSNIDNIQPLCKSCNSAKGDKNLDYRPDAGPLRWLQCKLFG